MESSRDLLDTVLAQPAKDVEAWLNGHPIGEPVGGESFNWEVFAFTAATRAGEERDLPWAHIALRVYEGLVKRSPARAAHSFWLSAMNLRARLIEDLGAQEGHAILDPQIVAAWFLRIATMPLEEASRLSSSPDLHAVPADKLIALRDIKNALNILSRLAGTDFVRNHPELHGWIRLRSQLP